MNLTDLLRRKSVERIQRDAAAGLSDAELHGGGSQLRRTLRLPDLTLMGIAAIVGAGIFAMIGKAANDGGPAVIFLFAFTAVACAFSALCYAEFASRIPVAGSAYTYAYASFGELIAWIIGWDLIVEYAIGNIAVAISWSGYFTSLLANIKIPALGLADGIKIPLYFTMDYVTAQRGFAAVQDAMSGGQTMDALKTGCGVVDAAINCDQIAAYNAWQNAPHLGGLSIICNLPALLICVVITALVYVGIRESKFASNIMTVLKIGVVLLVIVVGAFYVDPKNWSPFAPNGLVGVMKGVSAVFFAYIGFDALSTTAEECENPQRDLPRSMILSLVACTVLYIALALVMTGMVSSTKLNVSDPLAFVFGPEGVNISWIAGVISVSAVIALATVFLVFQIGQPRLWMAMSRDGLLPKIFSSIHSRYKTPWFSTIITGIVVAVPALFMNLTEVTDLASIGTLFAFTLVCGGVLLKDKDFGREKRFVPYIDSQFIAPAFFLIGLGLVLYFYPKALNDLFTLNQEFVAKEGALGAFSHKIPFIAFLLLALGLTITCIFKRLTLIPVLGVLSCAYLMTELGLSNWSRFGSWLLFGLAIYFRYSYISSHIGREAGRPERANVALNLAAVGFAASGLGLSILAFEFIANIFVVGALTISTVHNIALILFLIGLIVGIAGVIGNRGSRMSEQQ